MPHIDAPWDVLKKKYALYDRDFFLAEMNVDDKNTPEVSDDRPAEDFYITFDATAREPYTIRRKNEDELNFNLTFGFKPYGLETYSAFWRRYKRPPKREYWDFIVSRLDLLVPQDVRERKGSFFTPAIWVEKSQQYITDVLGENWQDEYYVWDCAGGTGNLEVGLTNKYRVWVSTLDQQDVDVMLERARNGANLLESHVFQFDFLNDSFDKLPKGLNEIIDDPEKRRRLVIYINPPYAEAGNKKMIPGTIKPKSGVSFESDAYRRFSPLIGTGARELFALFFMRIQSDIPGRILGEFSTLKHLQGTNFKAFRKEFKGDLLSAFLVPANTFDNVTGKFPIGFFVWRLGENVSRGGAEVIPLREEKSAVFTSAVADVYDRDGEFQGTKCIIAPDGFTNIISWLRESYDKSGARIAYLRMNGTNVQNNEGIFISQALTKNDLDNHFYAEITARNLMRFSVYYAVRKCIDVSWVTYQDQYAYPDAAVDLDETFLSNCLVFTLFDDKNRVKSSDGVNHWIPFTEEDVGAKDCFASHFMSDFINGRGERPRSPADARDARPYQDELDFENVASVKILPTTNTNSRLEIGNIGTGNTSTLATFPQFSPAARAVLDAGRELWRCYHAQPDANPNASYYDIRAYFQGCKPNGAMNAKSDDATYNALLATLRAAHKNLAAQIEPKVYEYGFLKR